MVSETVDGQSLIGAHIKKVSEPPSPGHFL